MTVPYPLDAFETAQPVRRVRAPKFNRDKLISVGITVAVHAVVLAMALTAVHVARPKVMQELTVEITPEKRQELEDIKPVPKLMTAIGIKGITSISRVSLSRNIGIKGIKSTSRVIPSRSIEFKGIISISRIIRSSSIGKKGISSISRVSLSRSIGKKGLISISRVIPSRSIVIKGITSISHVPTS